MKKKHSPDPFRRLEGIMARLRAPGGCPWDRRQTHKSLKPYLLEEVHEALEAIDQKDMKSLEEELGDVLLQVAFHSQIARENGRFNLRDVARTLGDKLVRRHPHVFGKVGKSSIREVNARWEKIKKAEKPERRSPLEGLPKSLPALHRAQRMHEKLAKGCPKESPAALKDALDQAWVDFQKALEGGSKLKSEYSLGEFLLSLTALANAKGIHAEMALRKASSSLQKKHRSQ